MKRTAIGVALLLGTLAAASHASTSGTEEAAWPELSLGDLTKVGVESASRKSQAVSNP